MFTRTNVGDAFVSWKINWCFYWRKATTYQQHRGLSTAKGKIFFRYTMYLPNGEFMRRNVKSFMNDSWFKQKLSSSDTIFRLLIWWWKWSCLFTIQWAERKSNVEEINTWQHSKTIYLFWSNVVRLKKELSQT